VSYALKSLLDYGLFARAEVQVDRVLEINEQVWKDPVITEQAIRELGDPPGLARGAYSSLRCLALLCETGEPIKTFGRNWDACVYAYGQERVQKDEGITFKRGQLRPRSNARSRPRGLHWVICEVGRPIDFNVDAGREAFMKNGWMLMGQELPMIAALHPQWVWSMNGQQVPIQMSPDLRVVNGKRRPLVPSLYSAGVSATKGLVLRVEDLTPPPPSPYARISLSEILGPCSGAQRFGDSFVFYPGSR